MEEAHQLGRGEGITEPRDIEIYSFAPYTSVEIGRLFSVMQSFLEIRNNILEETLLKLLLFKTINANLINLLLRQIYFFPPKNESFRLNWRSKTAKSRQIIAFLFISH